MAMTANEVDSSRRQVGAFADRVRAIRTALHEVVVGQDEVIDQLLVCALTGSHALLVGVPGLAKTLMIKALAAAFRWKYGRIQFTPDLMPADVTGYELLGRSDNGQGPSMTFRPGPVFANLVLADEINRAAPKTQSALLEAMAERHVTVGGKTYPLEEPFLVAATQNPIEQEGTYPLPEAQLDRFMMEIRIGYPTPEQEEEIVLRTTAGMPELPTASLDREEFLQLRDLVLAVPVANNVAAYAVRLCGASRPENSRRQQVCSRLRGMGCRSSRLAKSRAGGQSPRAVGRPHGPDGRGRPRHGSADPAPPHHRESPGGWRFGRFG